MALWSWPERKTKTDEVGRGRFTKPVATRGDVDAPTVVEVAAELQEYVNLAAEADPTDEDIANMGKTFHYFGNDAVSGGSDDEWIVTLSTTPRDKTGDGSVDESDVTVSVDGNTPVTSPVLNGADATFNDG